MIIERWGLPAGYPADQVPSQAREFALSTLDADYQLAVWLATEYGFNPKTKRLPAVKLDTQGQAIANVWSLHLTVEGEEIPFMVKLADPSPFHGNA